MESFLIQDRNMIVQSLLGRAPAQISWSLVYVAPRNRGSGAGGMPRAFK